MKVIKHGKLFPETPFKCDECECEFEYTPDDVYRGPVGCYVKCPECHKIHPLTEDGGTYIVCGRNEVIGFCTEKGDNYEKSTM